MKQSTTNTWVRTALFTALVAVSTAALAFPTPTGGYVNLGDIALLMGAYFLGPWYGALAGGFGAALADLLLGYAIYAPATLVIKATMAMTAGLLVRRFGESATGRSGCAVVAEAMMMVGYWLWDGFLSGSLLAAASGLPGNLVQAIFAVVGSTALVLALEKTPLRQSLAH